MTPKLRELAAQLCSALAADRVSYPWQPWVEVAAAIGAPYDARRLAWEALNATPSGAWHECWALAECLLRTGWCPS